MLLQTQTVIIIGKSLYIKKMVTQLIGHMDYSNLPTITLIKSFLISVKNTKIVLIYYF